MTDRPIIFSAPMIRALLEGRKTQTRRIIKPQPDPDGLAKFIDKDYWVDTSERKYKLPNVGDRLYVRENCAAFERTDGTNGVKFPANDAFLKIANTPEAALKWVKLYGYRGEKGAKVPSIHCPRWASRLTLVVTKVRVQKVQDISEDDAVAEGIERLQGGATSAFWVLWDSLNEKRGFGWQTDPWVVALTFDVHHSNIDRMKEAA